MFELGASVLVIRGNFGGQYGKIVGIISHERYPYRVELVGGRRVEFCSDELKVIGEKKSNGSYGLSDFIKGHADYARKFKDDSKVVPVEAIMVYINRIKDLL